MNLLIDKETIEKKIAAAGLQIEKEYAGKDLVIVTVLKGAICLVADLMKSINLPFELEVVQCSSYGARGKERGDLEIFGMDRMKIENRDILIVDDIFDSGQTLSSLVTAFEKKRAASVKSLVLLSKEGPRVTDYRPDFILFEIENRFVVGYGLDFKEHYRGLNGIYELL